MYHSHVGFAQWLGQNFNVFLKPVAGGPAFPLSYDGSENNYYTLRSFAWSPDSKKLVAYHVRPGYDRQIVYIESSPTDQIQPKHTTVHYAKPGDTLDIAYPALFDVASQPFPVEPLKPITDSSGW